MKKTLLTLLVLSFVISGLVLLKNSDSNIKAFSSPNITRENLRGTVTATKLNLRKGPSLNSKIISVLDIGQELNIYAKIDDWYLVFHPIKLYAGMVHKDYIEKQENNKEEQITVEKKQAQPSDNTTPSYNDTESNVSKNTSLELPKLPTIQSSNIDIKPTEKEEKLLLLINSERKREGLLPLDFNDKLIHSARLKSRDMIQKNYFSHQSPTYGSPFDMLRQFQINFKSAGENIAGNPKLEMAVSDWMASSSHRENILNPNFKYVGIGIENCPIYGNIIVKQLIS